ncbi:MAG: DNA primase [Desulfobulbaceae bacterium]|nr:DNA primase [Desulfobulbaceae bacterium]
METFRAQDEIKNRVRESTDIVRIIGESVELRKAGVNYVGLCPFHAEKTPSFSVNPGRQFFHCFGCGESGDAFSFMMKYHRLSFPEALKELARRAGIDLPERTLSKNDQLRLKQRERLYAVNEAAAELFQQTLLQSPVAEHCRTYLLERGIPDQAREKYRLGYAPGPDQGGWSYLTGKLQKKGLAVADIERAGLAVKKEHGGYYDRFRDRVLFPILDMSGRVVAFGGRILGEGKPKYMNSPESLIFDKSRLLFGLAQHKEAIREQRRALVVEGNFDLLSLAVHGVENVVAPLGTSLTRQHVRSLRGYCEEVVLLFDGDAAGLKAAMRSVPFFLAEQVEARVVLLPQGHDPDTLIREKGAGGIEELVEGALGLPEFVFDTLVKQHGLTLNGKNRIITELQPLFKTGDSRQRSLIVAHFSEKLGVSPAQMSTAAAGVTRPAAVGEVQGSRFKQLSRQHRQLVDFLILYPELLDELLDAGLEAVVRDPLLLDFITFLKQTAAAGPCTPETIFSALSDGVERDYVAELFMRAGTVEQEDGAWQREMCDELVGWLRQRGRLQDEAGLLQQIREAQQAGDQEKLMELLKRKQECGRKRTEFCDNMLKKE